MTPLSNSFSDYRSFFSIPSKWKPTLRPSKALQDPTPAFVIKLQWLLPEIVHQILDQLPLFKALNLLGHKASCIKKFVISHCHLGNLFQSLADVASVLDHFLLLRDVRVWFHSSLRDNYWDSITLWSDRGYNSVSLICIIKWM